MNGHNTMTTVTGFLIAFYSLCGVIVALALTQYFRRRRREKLLSQRPHEEVARLDRLQAELKEAEQRHTERLQNATNIAVDTPHLSIVKPQAITAMMPSTASNIAAAGAVTEAAQNSRKTDNNS